MLDELNLYELFRINKRFQTIESLDHERYEENPSLERSSDSRHLPPVSGSWKLGSMPLASTSDSLVTFPSQTQCRNFLWFT